MQLSNTKLLFTSCCDKLLARNSTTNQHLFDRINCRALNSSSKLTNRSSQLVTFEKISLQADNKLLSSFHVQNREQLNRQLNDCKYLKVNSINCKRHYSKFSNVKQQFVINSTVEEEDFKKDKQIDKRVFLNKILANRNEIKYQKLIKLDNDDKQYDELNYLDFKNSNRLKINENSLNTDSKSTNNKSNLNQTSTSRQQAAGQQDYTDLINVRSIYRNNLLNQSDQGNLNKMTGTSFKPKKALILTKFSRLEYERRRLVGCTEEEVKENVSSVYF